MTAKLPRPETARERECSEFVLKGAITRLALMFHICDRTFTGPEVAQILLTSWHKHFEAQQGPESKALPGVPQGTNGI